MKHFTLCLLFPLFCFGSKLTSLYSTLDPTSVSEHFAFYELYSDTIEGKQALDHAWKLLSGTCIECDLRPLALTAAKIQPILSLVNRKQEEKTAILKEKELQLIERLAQKLDNRKLKGASLFDEEKILQLADEEIDLARALLVAELKEEKKAHLKIRSYEANLDLMALQIQAKFPPNASPVEKLRKMNDYIFSEMRFRFPPHSLYAKEIDVYTFLPAVLDSRRGVCLGVSILYLSLAQRLGIPLEAVTPPGHIYVRYVGEGEEINIETTARGIHIPSKKYLGLDTRKLHLRSLKEVVGLAFMNQAAVFWHHENSKQAVKLYEKARNYLPQDDYLVRLFLGMNYLLIGEKKKGEALFKALRGVIPEHSITKENLIDDYLDGKTDIEGIEIVFSEVDEKRSSILQKQEKLKEHLKKYPEFRQAILHLAVTYLQLGREKEALPLLERYYFIDPLDPTVNYYLSSIHFQRKNFLPAWKYLKAAEQIVREKEHHPEALLELREALQKMCPETI